MKDSNSLFRQQAIQHKLSNRQTEVLLNRNPLMRPLLCVLCASFVGLILLINQIKYKEVQTARGRLVSEQRDLQIVAPQDGNIQTILVEPGEPVQNGDIVARLSRHLYDHAGRAITEQQEKALRMELRALKRERELQQKGFSLRAASLHAGSADMKENIRIVSYSLTLLKEQE